MRHVGLARNPLLWVGAGVRVVIRVARVAGASSKGTLAVQATEALVAVGTSEPWVAQGLVRGQAIAGADLQQPEDEVQRAFGHVLPRLLWEAEIALDDLPVEFVQHIV